MNAIILKTLFYLFCTLILLFLIFKKIRAVLPIPMINNDKLVGYAQYYGYPIYFDTVFFFLIIILPVIILLSLYFWEKRK